MVIYLIILFSITLIIKMSFVKSEEVTIASGDQISLILSKDIVKCTYIIMLTSDSEIKGDFNEIISFKGKIIGTVSYEFDDLEKCSVYTTIKNGTSYIYVSISNITLLPSKLYSLKLTYDIDDLIKYINETNIFDYLFTTTGKTAEIIVKVPKESHQFEDVIFYDVVPIPTIYYEDNFYYVYVWNRPITVFGTEAKYYIKLIYKSQLNFTEIGTFLLSTILLSVILSLVSRKTWDYLNRPILKIETIPKEENREPTIQKLNSQKRAFYHIKIFNKGRTSVYDCEIFITFLDCEGNEFFRLKGKWDKSPEPLIPLAFQLDKSKPNIVVQDYPYPSLISLSEMLNIRPKSSETFCIVMKYEGEKECYGFSAWNYIKGYESGLRVEEWGISAEKFLVKVEIRGANCNQEDTIQIENIGEGINDVNISVV